MRNINLRTSVITLLAVSLVLWFGIASIRGEQLTTIWDFIKILPLVATIDIGLYWVFAKWGWRWRIFKRWLVPFPNLNGTWQGVIQSNWVDSETGKSPPPIRTLLTIRQSYDLVSCVMRTEETASHSYIEALKIDPDRQMRKLIYCYSSQPKPSVRHRSEPHDGTIVFDIIEGAERKLRGRYWTDRMTTGGVNLEFLCKDLLDEMPSEETES